MADRISLDPRGLEAALAVLDREQTACLPTERELRLYRAFSVTAYLMAPVAVLSVLAMTAAEVGVLFVPRAVLLALVLLAPVLGIGTLVLFILNWSLIRKLYRHAQLRRRLQLTRFLEPAFTALRSATRAGNVVTMLMVVLGALLTLAGALLLLAAIAAWSSTGLLALNTMQFLILVPIPLAVLGTGLGLGSLHFMRRGKQRLELVLRLQANLAKRDTGPGQPSQVTLSADDYEAIAGLEREHIIRERASSIVSGRKESDSTGYLCQSSRQMLAAKSGLAPELLMQVEGAIASLLTDPAPPAAVHDPHTGRLTFGVAGTPLSIQYDVDRQRRLVRLYDLQATAAEAGAGPGGVHGIS